MIAPELRSLLVCPVCKGELEFHEEEIICRACGLAFPIQEGIPNFLPDEARKLEDRDGAER